MANLVKPDRSAIVDENGNPTEKFFQWLQLATDLDPITGTGSPEGVQEARVPRSYVDTSAAPGSTYYVKRLNDISGDRTMGWRLIG